MSVPPIRLFQFSGEGVNLFRGDVNLALTLLSLPSGSNLDVAVNLLYRSNVQDSVDTWNLDAPTGTIGLGWSLASQRIEVGARTSGSVDDNRYILVENDNPSLLARSGEAWPLLDLASGHVQFLQAGDVSSEIRREFAVASIPLSGNCRVSGESRDGPWRVYDDDYERVYKLSLGPSSLLVEDGGLGFELESYQFWKIRYYADYEKWLVVKDNGIASVFGGGVTVGPDVASSVGNSIQWGVRRGNWFGDSALPIGERYPVAWNLASDENLWGDRVEYTYETVEQPVGQGGVPYTKACRPSCITDALGRTVTFAYEPKEWYERPEGPREYMDPHKAIPNDGPNAYQDRYETRYLKSISVCNERSEHLLTVHFDSSVENATSIPTSNPLYGDTCKRFLRGIFQTNDKGQAQPGLVFDYYWSALDPHPGALRTVTSAQGGTVTYVYRRVDLDLCQKSKVIDRPADGPADGWAPRVWFGPDYAVVAWYKSETGVLKISLYTWVGFWYEWIDPALTFVANLDLDTLDARTSDEFVALSYDDASGTTTTVHLLHKAPNRIGQWEREETLLVYPLERTRVVLNAGGDFLTVLEPDTATLDCYTWNWRCRDPAMGCASWTKNHYDLRALFGSSSTAEYFGAAASRYYVLLCYDPDGSHNTLKIFHQDALGGWEASGTTHPNDIVIGGQGSVNLFWSLSDTLAVATYVTHDRGTYYDYRVQVFQWDGGYQFSGGFRSSVLRADKGAPFIATVTGDSLVGSGAYLFRYNGRDWQAKELDLSIPMRPGNLLWLAQGSDLVLITENSATRVISQLAVYDPDVDSEEWSTPPLRLVDVVPSQPHEMYYFPTAGPDYVTLNKSVYFRGSSTDWRASVRKAAYEIPPGQIVDTTTMYDQAPDFLSYLQYEEEGGALHPRRTRVLNLKNGAVANVEAFEERIFQVYDEQGYPKTAADGKVPVGPDAVVTYVPMGEEWDSATSITLRRCLNTAVAGKVPDYAVVRMESDDGFQTSIIGYDYDLSSAVCDPSGRVVKYYRAATYLGATGPGAGREGHTSTVYVNGLPGDVDGIDHPPASTTNNVADNYSILDGFVDRTETYDADGVLVASQANDWLVKTTKRDARQNLVPLRGAYAVLAAVRKTLDGITTIAGSDYDAFSGEVVRRTTSNVNARGRRETWSEEYTYAYQVYPVLAALNSFPAVAQVTSLVEEEEAVAVERAYVTRFRAWPTSHGGRLQLPVAVYGAWDTYVWLGGTGHWDFSSWNVDETPGPAWQRGGLVATRADNGAVVEVEDTLGRFASTLYDNEGRRPIATFSNARLLGDEADYLGFEAYEQGGGWRMMPSGRSWRDLMDDAIAHTGECSLRLTAATTGSDGIEKTFRPNRDQARFLFSCWYRTARGFAQEGEQAGWRIMVSAASGVLQTIFVPFVESAEKWSYLSRPVDLFPHRDNDQLAIMLRGFNATEVDVFLDDLRFSPLECRFQATVYDHRHGLPVAVLGPNDQTLRTCYDAFQRVIGGVGPDENVNAVRSQYLARQDHPLCSAVAPNAMVSLSGRGAGFYAGFRRDGGYGNHWRTSEPEQWSVTGSSLVHSGRLPGTIALVNRPITGSDAVSVLVYAPDEPQNDLGLSIGPDVSVTWDPPTRTWRLRTWGLTTTSDVQARLQTQWLLSVRGDVVLFFADGAKLFAAKAPSEVSGAFALFAEDPVEFSEVLVTSDPQIALSYSDGGGKERQALMLSGEDSIVSQTVYDSLARPAVLTKAARMAPTVSCPILSYRFSFVEGLDWDTGIMTGEVSRYYSSSGGGHTDDQGYPYSRTRFERSPLGRPVERGVAGRDFAIRDLSTTTPGERHTTKISYFANRHDGFMDWLPAGSYFARQTTDPDGNVAIVVEDQAGNTIGRGVLLDGSTRTYQTTSYEGAYSNIGKTAITYLPNYHAPPPDVAPAPFRRVECYDMLGRLVARDGPDTGRTEIISDPAGVWRFSQDAVGREAGYYRYARYDPLGRLIEDGVVEGTWDPAVLWERASHDPSWPPTPPTWGRRLAYDGTGLDPRQVLQLVSVTTHGNLDGAIPVAEESYVYDIGGDVTEHTLRLPADGRSFTTRYEYNNQRQVTATTYPGAVTLHLRSDYDPTGLLTLIESDDGLRASYAYNADDTLQWEELRWPGAPGVRRTYSYLSPGWLTSVRDPFFQQTVYYDRDADRQPGYYSGLVAAEQFSLSEGADGVVPRVYGYRYTYDALGRLVVAAGSTADMGREAPPSEELSYDSNGNLLTVRQGDERRKYAYYEGTDETKNTTGSGEAAYTYDRAGATTGATPLGINDVLYNPTTGRPQRIVTTADDVHLAYDGLSRRLTKTSDGASKLYLRGLGADPLVETIVDPDGLESSVIYVYGARSLIAFVRDGRLHRVLSDRLGSTRAVIDAEGRTVQAFAYLPFGGRLAEPEDEPPIAPYLYTGQEWDGELGLYNFKARFYDPRLRRFTEPDPVLQWASPYTFVGNNPILFVDPSGEFSWQAGVGIGIGAALLIAGVALTVVTAGTAAPSIAIGGAILGGALSGFGASSLVYSATHTNDWKVGEWGLAVTIGTVTGALSGGAGVAIGRSVAAAAVSMAVSSATRTVVTVGARVAATAVADSIVNVGVTSAAYGITGVTDSKAYVDAAWQGVTAGVLGGAFAGLGGTASGVRSGLRSAARDTFDPGSVDNLRALTPTNDSKGGGLTGLLDVNTRKLTAINAVSVPGGAPYGSAHLQAALHTYGEAPATRLLESEGSVADYPNLRGWSALRLTSEENPGGRNVLIKFGSNSLNLRRDGAAHERLVQPNLRPGILLAARYQANIRNLDVLVPSNTAGTEETRYLAALLRSPFS